MGNILTSLWFHGSCVKRDDQTELCAATTQLRNTLSVSLTRDLSFLLDINSPYLSPYTPFNISCENLVLYQCNIS